MLIESNLWRWTDSYDYLLCLPTLFCCNIFYMILCRLWALTDTLLFAVHFPANCKYFGSAFLLRSLHASHGSYRSFSAFLCWWSLFLWLILLKEIEIIAHASKYFKFWSSVPGKILFTHKECSVEQSCHDRWYLARAQPLISRIAHVGWN